MLATSWRNFALASSRLAQNPCDGRCGSTSASRWRSRRLRRRRLFNKPGVVLGPAPLIVERYERWASPDRIGPVQDAVWAKYVVAWWIAVDRAGFIHKELPPDLDPEAACGRPAPLAGHVIGHGHETAGLMTVGSTLFCVRACGRFGHSAGHRARQCQQCRHADHAAMMLRAVPQGQDILPMNSSVMVHIQG
jgi:hypothetical protein